MTTICWDGEILAADRRLTFGTHIRTCTKISRHFEYLLATSGNADAGAAMENWFREGRDPEKFPVSQRNDDSYSPLIAISKEGILRWDTTPFPIKIEDKQYAIGSGANYAIAAMHCGKTAREAVEIAALFDSATGNGVDILTLD